MHMKTEFEGYCFYNGKVVKMCSYHCVDIFQCVTMCVGRESHGNEHWMALKINQKFNFPGGKAVFHGSLSSGTRL